MRTGHVLTLGLVPGTRPHTPRCAPDDPGPSDQRRPSAPSGRAPSAPDPVGPAKHLRASGRPAGSPKVTGLILSYLRRSRSPRELDPVFRTCAHPIVSASRSRCPVFDRAHPAGRGSAGQEVGTKSPAVSGKPTGNPQLTPRSPQRQPQPHRSRGLPPTSATAARRSSSDRRG